MPTPIEEIKARIDVVDLVSEYVRLKQSGTNWKGLCPFHNEKTPSFMVSREKQIWHCFGCSEGGDIFSFIQKIEGLEFAEALRLLAKKAGVQLEHVDADQSTKKNRLLDVCQLAANFWHQTLLQSKAAAAAAQYLKHRQVSDDIISEFKIGYAAESWDTLIKFLRGRGFSNDEIFLAGLSVKKERGEGFYDRFRDRIMFPVNDLHGNTVGFSGRTLKPDAKEAKYINTPQTAVYNKSLVLFNLDKAKQEIKKQNLVIVVEGQMDALSSYQAGVTNVVASSGTAFTLDQIKILKRYTNNLAIAFDADVAGESASLRGIDLALKEEMNVKVIVLPYGKDPDECIKHNVDDWTAAIKNAKSIMEYYFEQVSSRFDLAKAEGKKEAGKILLSIINKIGNKIEQAHWLQQLGGLLNVSEQILRETLQNIKPDNPDTRPAAGNINKPPQIKSRDIMIGELILGLGLKFPNQLNRLIENLLPEMLPEESLQGLYKSLIIYYTTDISNSADQFDYSVFLAKIDDQKLRQLADTLVLLAEKEFFDFDHDAIKSELAKLVNFLKRGHLTKLLKDLEGKIRQAEKVRSSSELNELSSQFDDIASQLKLLE